MEPKYPPLTYSMIRDFDCPCKFYHRQLLHLRPVVTSESLAIGSLFHEWREKGEEWAVEEVGKVRVLSQSDEDKRQKLEALILGMLRGATLAFNDPPSVEREPEWLQPIVNPDTGRTSKKFWTAGKADGLILEGGNCIIEEKTTAQINDADIGKLDLDMQVLNEVSNLQRSRGVTIPRVLYRFIRKPSIQQTQKESVVEFCDRLMADYQNRPEFYFREVEILVDQARVRAWERDLWRIANIINYCIKHDIWYRNTSRCAEWGGCSFLPLCRGEDVGHMYEVREANEELTREGTHDGIQTA